ncbi:hypothetical protein FGRMN_2729 [Fusarium graminum]|nr:hypothetical protein FGRMN_2729 [Fusarium graminum]
MKFTTFATALFTLGFGADLAAAACCDMKVCTGFNLKGRCKTACYPYGSVVQINGDGLRGTIASGKTDTDCFCTVGVENRGDKNRGSCTKIDSNRKGTNLQGTRCLGGVDSVQCMPK